MAHFVRLENNIVVQGIVVHNNELLVDGVENEAKGREFCNKLLGGEWIQTSYNNNFRKQYAGIGMEYLPATKNFRAQQPYPSWTRVNKTWQAPTPIPSTGGPYTWSEEELAWVAV